MISRQIEVKVTQRSRTQEQGDAGGRFVACDVIGDVVVASSVVPRRSAIAPHPSGSTHSRRCRRLPGRSVHLADCGRSQPESAGRRPRHADDSRHIQPVPVLLPGVSGAWPVAEFPQRRRGEPLRDQTSIRHARSAHR